MKRTLDAIFYSLILLTIAGCSQLTLPMTDLPKDVQGIELKWQEDDKLVFYTEEGLFYLFPHSTPKTLLAETPTEKERIQLTYSQYYASSPDNSQYILLTNSRKDIEIHSFNTNQSKLLVHYSDRILSAGWFDDEKIFYTTKYGLFLVDILSGEQFQVSEDSREVYAKAAPNIEEPYISWVDNVKKIGGKLYYNGNRNYPDLATSSIYCGDESGEKKLLNNAVLSTLVDERRFVYYRWYPQKPAATFYLYDLETGKSSLITKNHLLSPGNIFTTDGKLVFMTGETTGEIYQGTIFDPVTLQAQTFQVYQQDMLDTELAHHQFGKFMGAFEDDGGYIFLFSIQNKISSPKERDTIYLAYNTKTAQLTEILHYDDLRTIDLHISPSGKYLAVCKYPDGSNDFKFDVINLTAYCKNRIKSLVVPGNRFFSLLFGHQAAS